MACEMYKILQHLNPNLVCNKNCSQGVECGLDIKLVQKRPVPQSKPVGASASYNAKTIPQSKIVTN